MNSQRLEHLSPNIPKTSPGTLAREIRELSRRVRSPSLRLRLRLLKKKRHLKLRNTRKRSPNSSSPGTPIPVIQRPGTPRPVTQRPGTPRPKTLQVKLVTKPTSDITPRPPTTAPTTASKSPRPKTMRKYKIPEGDVKLFSTMKNDS